METKEALRDRYVKTQQEGMFVEGFHVSGEYMDPIGDVLRDRLSEFHTGEPVKYVVAGLGTATPVTDEHMVSIGEEEAISYAYLAGAANFIQFVPEGPVGKAEPVARLDWLHEAFPKKEQGKVYPGSWVSSEEYERRFKGVDLDYFQKAMPPELFEAYLRTMGAIEGWGIKPRDRFKGKD